MDNYTVTTNPLITSNQALCQVIEINKNIETIKTQVMMTDIAVHAIFDSEFRRSLGE